MAYRASVIKSIEYGSINVEGVASKPGTIATVDVNNTILIHLGHNTAYSGGLYSLVHYTRIELTNATTVTAFTGGALVTGAPIPVRFAAVQFYPGIFKSLQYKTITFGASATGSVALTAVNVAKTVLLPLGFVDINGTQSFPYDVPSLTLTSSVLVSGTKANAVTGTIAGFVAVEFK